jgi:hypothetical protein
MEILYDYLTLEGDSTWYMPPAEVVSTRNVDAVRTSGSGGSTQLTAQQVISSVQDGPSVPSASAAPAAATASAEAGPAVKKTSATKKKTSTQ